MMKSTVRFFVAISMLVLAVAITPAQHAGHHQTQADKPKSDQAHQHDAQAEGVNQRGDQAMGFAHTKTTHHFRLKADGGEIEVTANDPADTASRDQIRTHLNHIARKFAAGDFAAPMFIHSQTPPGVPVMQEQKAGIKYRFEELETGGRVRITTKHAEAVQAIHEFLRFQIKDHQTGDSLEVIR